MNTTNFPEREWWEKIGCRKLNDVLINIEPDNIGWVPLLNLIPEMAGFNQAIMFEIIKDDGPKFAFQNKGFGYITDQEEIYIYLD
ncbi:MAG: hypothetical protein IJI66_13880 [Erysipelotrichaceae bacterium]|nr:hypothetical protein [Erysipelotrichaceae bacterium]